MDVAASTYPDDVHFDTDALRDAGRDQDLLRVGRVQGGTEAWAASVAWAHSLQAENNC